MSESESDGAQSDGSRGSSSYVSHFRKKRPKAKQARNDGRSSGDSGRGNENNDDYLSSIDPATYSYDEYDKALQAILDEKSVEGSGYFTVVDDKDKGRQKQNSERLTNLIRNKPDFDFGRGGRNAANGPTVAGDVHITKLGDMNPDRGAATDRSRKKAGSEDRPKKRGYFNPFESSPSKAGYDSIDEYPNDRNKASKSSCSSVFQRMIKNNCRSYAQWLCFCMGFSLLCGILIIMAYVNSNAYRMKLRHAAADSHVENFVPKEYPPLKKGYPPNWKGYPPTAMPTGGAVLSAVRINSQPITPITTPPPLPATSPKVFVPVANHRSAKLHNQSVIYRSTFPVSWNPSLSPRRSLVYCYENAIHMVDPVTRKDTVITGQGSKPTGSKEHIPMEEAKLDGPFSPVWDQSDNLYFLDDHGMNLHRIDMHLKKISTYFTHKAYDDVTKYVQKIAINRNNNQVFLIYRNHLAMVNGSRFNAQIVAGSPTVVGSSGDGKSALQATFGAISSVAFDQGNNIYVSDTLYHNIRVIFRNGVIRTLAGKSIESLDSLGHSLVQNMTRFSGDGGLAIDAELNRPTSMAITSTGDVYFTDSKNYRIRRVSKADGAIETVVGTGQLKSQGEDLNTGLANQVSLCAIQESVLSVKEDTKLYLRSFCHTKEQYLDYVVSEFVIST